MSSRQPPSNRAVSDLIAFTLTFAIIIGSVSVLYFAGFTALEDYRDEEDINSAERVMSGIAESLEDVHRQTVPGRSIEATVDRGELTLRESNVTIEVNFKGSTSGPSETLDVNALELVPAEGNTAFRYESGSVFRVRNEAALVRHRPVFSCTDTSAVMSIVTINGNISVSREGTVELVNQREKSRLVFPDPAKGQAAGDFGNVSIDISNTRSPDAWRTYFRQSEDDWKPQGQSDVYYCDGVKAVYVRQTTINIQAIY